MLTAHGSSAGGRWARLIDGVILSLVGVAVWNLIPPIAERISAPPVIIPEAGDVATLLVVFQPADCASYASFISDWRRVERDSVTVIGVPVGSSGPVAAREAATAFAVRFPLRPDLARPALSMLEALGGSTTPVAILLDARGRPRLVIPGRQASESRLEIQALLLGYRASAMRYP